MKITISESKRRINFPKLMISDNGLIVLMKNNGIGVVLNKGASSNEIGTLREDWVMQYFRDFEGDLILSNN